MVKKGVFYTLHFMVKKSVFYTLHFMVNKRCVLYTTLYGKYLDTGASNNYA